MIKHANDLANIADQLKKVGDPNNSDAAEKDALVESGDFQFVDVNNLAAEIERFIFTLNILDSYGNMIPVLDLYCLINRGSSTRITALDFSKGLQNLNKDKLVIKDIDDVK